MLDVDYYLGEAEKYRKLAARVTDERIRKELLEMAAICERIAQRILDHMPAG